MEKNEFSEKLSEINKNYFCSKNKPSIPEHFEANNELYIIRKYMHDLEKKIKIS